MPTITQRENGKWQAKVRCHGVTTSETFSTKSAAESWARRQESEVERGLWRDNSEAERTLLRDALDRYRDEVSVKKRGHDQERSLINILRDAQIARVTLARIRSADIASLVELWRKSGAAPATISRRLALLSHVFETARKSWGMDGLGNPVRLIQLPKLNNARERRVTDDEIEALCQAAAQTACLPAMIRIAVETGMRRGEIVGMHWQDIDLEKRVVRLPMTKNGYARDVPLSSRAVDVLRKQRRNISGQVFQVREDSVTQAFDRACVRAQVEDLRFHDLRHEATSRLAEKLSVHELAKVTGHRDLRMLMRYYHPRAEDLARKLG
ncbi:MAG: site-specific integrase [Rhodocyclales bacterium]|nr:site-specific integrase [Rhodocyclales bacterium]